MATEESDVVHDIVLSPSVSVGIVAVIFVDSPLSSDIDDLSSMTEPISLVTVTSQDAVVPFSVVAVIVVFPLVNAVIVPSCDILAIDSSDDDHFTFF